jgi:hypothetical protein
MPFFKTLDRGRIELADPVSAAEVDRLAGCEEIKILQCGAAVQDATWDLLNDRFFRMRPEVKLRLYGFYDQVCDLGFCARMDQVCHFASDCLMSARHVDAIASMPSLLSLGVGIYDLESLDFLLHVPSTLRRLFLGATRSKKPDLAPLRRFGDLTELYIEGQQKNIEVLSDLPSLEDLTLRSISTPTLDYLRGLPKLWSLDIKLGGIRDLSAIEGSETIKYLELWQIRGLDDVRVLSHLPGIQSLFLQSLPQISALPPLRQAWRLRRVFIQNLKGLRDLTELEWAPALEEFILAQGQGQQPEDLVPLLRNPRLRRANAGFGSTSRNARFIRLRNEHGIEGFPVAPFQFS